MIEMYPVFPFDIMFMVRINKIINLLAIVNTFLYKNSRLFCQTTVPSIVP